MDNKYYIKQIQNATNEWHWTSQGLSVSVWYACSKTFLSAIKYLANTTSVHFDTIIDHDGDIVLNHFDDALAVLNIKAEDIFTKN